MSLQFGSQRAAEEFASVLDGTAVLDVAVAERYAPLLHTATMLRERPQPVPRPEFVLDLRERLLAAADELLLAPAPAVASLTDARKAKQARPGRRHERLIGAAAATVVLVGGTAGLAAAAQHSLPGEQLYPVKRGIENVELSLTPNSAARGRELLGQAATRLDEVRAMVDSSSQNVQVNLIESTLRSFNTSANKGAELLFTSYQGQGNSGDISDVRQFTASHMSLLESLAKQSPPTANAAFSEAGQTLADIDQQARVLCVTCANTNPVMLPSALMNLVSARSLAALVTVPTTEAGRSADAAARAHARKQHATRSGKTAATGKHHAHSAAGLPPAPSGLGSGSASGPVGQPKGGGSQPVQGLLNGITSATPTPSAPSGGKTSGQPGDPVSSLLGDTVNQVGTTGQDLGKGVGSSLDPANPDASSK